MELALYDSIVSKAQVQWTLTFFNPAKTVQQALLDCELEICRVQGINSAMEATDGQLWAALTAEYADARSYHHQHCKNVKGVGGKLLSCGQEVCIAISDDFSKQHTFTVEEARIIQRLRDFAAQLGWEKEDDALLKVPFTAVNLQRMAEAADMAGPNMV